MIEFEFKRTGNPKKKPIDESKLGFGKIFTDHMFRMDFNEEKGWHDGRIIPYSPIQLDPAACVLHYAQETFEGLKAFRNDAGETFLFRPLDNIRRLNESCERLCIPKLEEEVVLDAIKAIVKVEEDWIPKTPGTSLYVRPFIIATEAFLGLHASNEYAFIIILSPSGHYYPQGLAPTNIYVEDEDVRAAVGGTGYAKLGANYAISLRAQIRAQKQGYDQVLWLDGIERKYVEEIGTSNAFFVIDGVIITSPLTGTILPGVTRRTVIELLREKGFQVDERRLSIDELTKAAKSGRLEEAFATGTAAVIAPVGSFHYKGVDYIVNNNKIGFISQFLYTLITEIQRGATINQQNWVLKVE
ncbi:MAG TPA: branched-chain amino acid aminotransferase [Anaerovoracaceae bacterium]|nr:branched-chain amino acid aminotransferase [Anaerovoracaceae bacterium]